MENLKNNKIFWVLIGFTIVNLSLFLFGKVLVDKVADRVIQRLQKDYSPSPYGPGFDPDKVSPDAFKTNKRYFVMRTEGESEKTTDRNGAVIEFVREADVWRDGWEKDRGFNPEP